MKAITYLSLDCFCSVSYPTIAYYLSGEEKSFTAGSSNSIQASDCARFLAGHRLTQQNSKHACMTRKNGLPKEINPWAMYPRKTSTSPLPESLKMEVTKKANELIETVLKPKYIQPPPDNPQFNLFPLTLMQGDNGHVISAGVGKDGRIRLKTQSYIIHPRGIEALSRNKFRCDRVKADRLPLFNLERRLFHE